jgi:hypothetical protein
MRPPLVNDDLWTRRGISLLWDADELNRLCHSKQVISLRQFIQYYRDGWPEHELPLVDEVTMVVAGLEACVDALCPDEATEWLENTIYQAMVSFQSEVASGGTQAALVFWFVDPKRLQYETGEGTWYMHYGGEFKGHKIAISRCLFNGADNDLKEIQDVDGKALGLYHPRIS